MNSELFIRTVYIFSFIMIRQFCYVRTSSSLRIHEAHVYKYIPICFLYNLYQILWDFFWMYEINTKVTNTTIII